MYHRTIVHIFTRNVYLLFFLMICVFALVMFYALKLVNRFHNTSNFSDSIVFAKIKSTMESEKYVCFDANFH